MGSAATPGFKAFVQVSFDSGATYSNVSEQKAASFDQDLKTINVNNKTTSVNVSGLIVDENIAVGLGWGISIDANWLNDTVQNNLLTAALAGTAVLVRFLFPIVQAGQKMLYGTGYVKFSGQSPLTDANTVKYTFIPAAGTILTLGTQS